MTKNQPSVNEFMKQAIAKKRMAVIPLARKIGVDPSSVYRYLGGQTQISSDVFLSMVNALSFSEAELKELLEVSKSGKK